MLQYERIDISEAIDLNKSDKSKECMICHYNHMFLSKYFKTFIENNFTFISPWESKGLSNEKLVLLKHPIMINPPG